MHTHVCKKFKSAYDKEKICEIFKIPQFSLQYLQMEERLLLKLFGWSVVQIGDIYTK